MAPHSDDEKAGLNRIGRHLSVGSLKITCYSTQRLGEPRCNKSNKSNPNVKVARPVSGRCGGECILTTQEGIVDASDSGSLASVLLVDHKPLEEPVDLKWDLALTPPRAKESTGLEFLKTFLPCQSVSRSVTTRPYTVAHHVIVLLDVLK